MTYISIFSGVRELMKADRICKKNGITIKVIPLPHKYTTECGMALLIEEQHIELFTTTLQEHHIHFEIYPY